MPGALAEIELLKLLDTFDNYTNNLLYEQIVKGTNPTHEHYKIFTFIDDESQFVLVCSYSLKSTVTLKITEIINLELSAVEEALQEIYRFIASFN